MDPCRNPSIDPRGVALVAVLMLAAVLAHPRGGAAQPITSVSTSVSIGRHAAIDDLGDTVQLAEPARRIVSLAPSNTELLFGMGLGDRLVGVTEFCNYPAEVDSIAHVSGYSTLSVESIVASEPDLVVAARGNDLEGLQTLRGLGIPVFALDIQTVDQLFSAIERLDRLCSAGSAATGLATDLHRRIDAVKRRVRRRVSGIGDSPGVIWCYWGEPVYTAGEGTIIDDIIARAGGRNVARQSPGAWPQVSLESIISWAPEVIITSYLPGGINSMDEEMERVRSLDGWKTLPAVRTGRVHYIDIDILSRPGPRSVDALEKLAALLHPVEAD